MINFFKEEKSTTSTEYALLLALVVSVGILAITTFGKNINETFKSVLPTTVIKEKEIIIIEPSKEE